MTTNTRLAATATVFAAVVFTVGFYAGGYGKEPVDTAFTGPPTHNNTVIVTPDSCLQALDAADEGFKLTIKLLNAIGTDDLAEAEALQAQIAPTLTPYRVNRDKCRIP